VLVVDVVLRSGGRTTAAGSPRGRGRGTLVGIAALVAAGGVAAATARRAAFAAAEELEVLEDNLQLAALLAGGLVVPLVETETALDEEGASLGAVFADEFALFTPGFDIDEGGLLASLAALVLEGARDGEAELADGGALGRDADFGVAGQVADEKD